MPSPWGGSGGGRGAELSSGPGGLWPRLGVAAGVLLCPPPEGFGLLAQLAGQLQPHHPLPIGVVQQQQQVLQHCGGNTGGSGGVSAQILRTPAPPSPKHPPWTARVLACQQ